MEPGPGQCPPGLAQLWEGHRALHHVRPVPCLACQQPCIREVVERDPMASSRRLLSWRMGQLEQETQDEAKEVDSLGLIPEHSQNSREGAKMGHVSCESVQLGAKMLGSLDMGMDETSFIALDSWSRLYAGSWNRDELN